MDSIRVLLILFAVTVYGAVCLGWWSIVPPWNLPIEYLGFLFYAFMLVDPVTAIFHASLLVLFLLLLHFRNPRLLIVIFVVQAIAAWRLLRLRW